ncbi:MAG: hypothetical protein QM723_13215 [Myxococcaceae bacterium]
MAGGKWLSELLNVSVFTALLLDNHVKAVEVGKKDRHSVPPFIKILPIQQKHPLARV